MKPDDFSHLARTGSVLDITVRPSARRYAITMTDTGLRVEVTDAPEKGRANGAVLTLLSQALNVPKTRLQILRGASGRKKRIRILPD